MEEQQICFCVCLFRIRLISLLVIVLSHLEGEDSVLAVEWTGSGTALDVDTVNEETALGLVLLVLTDSEAGESHLVGNADVLATRELVLGTTASLNAMAEQSWLGANGQNDLTNLDASGKTVWLTPGTTHTGLETISTGARKHLVNTQNVVWVSAHAKVEGILTALGGHVLVHNNTGSFESLRRELFELTRAQMDARRELLIVSITTANVENANLWLRNTTAETRLDVRLVLTVAVALSWTATHFVC